MAKPRSSFDIASSEGNVVQLSQLLVMVPMLLAVSPPFSFVL